MVDPLIARIGVSAGSSALKAGWTAIRPSLARRNVLAGKQYDFHGADARLGEVLDMLSGRAEGIRSRAERLRQAGGERYDPLLFEAALRTLTHCAGVYREAGLAKLAADIARSVTEESKEDNGIAELFCILDGASAFRDDEEYCTFVGDRLERLAFGRLRAFSIYVDL